MPLRTMEPRLATSFNRQKGHLEFDWRLERKRKLTRIRRIWTTAMTFVNDDGD